jgi:hypothetical protein
MKMGTVASPSRYSAVRVDATRVANPRMGGHVPFAFAAPRLWPLWRF